MVVSLIESVYSFPGDSKKLLHNIFLAPLIWAGHIQSNEGGPLLHLLAGPLFYRKHRSRLHNQEGMERQKKRYECV